LYAFPLALSFFLAAASLAGQSGSQVLLVVNGNDAASREIGAYYRPRRSIPVRNVCTIAAPTEEEISWDTYVRQVERPVAACLESRGLRETVLYIVTTMGTPLKVTGGGTKMSGEYASVDSELALLYAKMKGEAFPRAGPVANPFFGKRDAVFRHPDFPMYLVTRLAAYDGSQVKAMIDRGLAARNRGKFVFDLSEATGQGNDWLRTAAMLLPRRRIVMDETEDSLYRQKDVIGYASWGSNDGNRKRRWLGFQWLPGAIATEFVSSNGRTFKRPPDGWTFKGWDEKLHLFGGSSQSLSGDFIQEGAAMVNRLSQQGNNLVVFPESPCSVFREFAPPIREAFRPLAAMLGIHIAVASHGRPHRRR
jgi:uncharacterized protein (TIGR03790 family)